MGSAVRKVGKMVQHYTMPWTGAGTWDNNIIGNAFAPGLYTLYGEQQERKERIASEETAVVQSQNDAIAAKQAEADRIAKAAADKIAADKAKADEEAAKAATLLAIRRRASSPYGTSQQGILGGAPTTRKTLLGG
jgi:hypothetical protein